MRRLVLVLSVVVCACAQPPAPAPAAMPEAPEFINLVEPWPYPFSSAVRSGDLIFVSGQIGTVMVDGAPRLIEGGLDAEVTQTMDNIKAVVEHAGSSMSRVVKCTVMLGDIRDWPRFNEIYATYFPGPKPARAAFGGVSLALGARVEVDCIAQR
jgi:reactive intermediate/imine deaminase